jgi:hypothetical protein
LNVSGIATFQSDVKLGDSDALYFGDGNDLKIFHDGSNSIIQDNGTGNLYILASNQLALQSNTSENYLIGNADGSVDLYFNNSKKFETTNNGVQITGVTTSTGGFSGALNGDVNAGIITSNTSLYVSGALYDVNSQRQEM